jgi:hypothetical protein
MDHDAYDPTTDSAFEPSEHESDTFSAQDDVAVGTRNKRQPKKKATVPKKRARRTRQSATRDIDAPASLIAREHPTSGRHYDLFHPTIRLMSTVGLMHFRHFPSKKRWLMAP